MMLLLASAMAQEVSGFTELRVSAFTGVEATVPVFVVERFRPTFSAPLGDTFALSTTLELNLSQGWRSTTAAQSIAEDAGVDLSDAFGESASNSTLGISTVNDYLGVDRLYLDVYTDKADLRLGRQALNWGSAFVVNPSDPFPEVLLTEPWKPRSGVNAAKASLPMGDLHTLQLVAATDDAFLHPRLAARATFNALQADWSVVGAWREEAGEVIVGLDVKGTLGVGYWFEGVVHVDGGDPYEELAVGLDYSFPVLEQLVVTAQYYRNGAGAAESSAGFPLLDERTAFAPAFARRNYLMGAVSAGITPDLSASALWMQNLDDGTAFVVPTVALVASGAIDVSFAVQLPVDLDGNGGEFRPDADDLVVSVPTADGLVPVDFSPVVPSATFVVWTRFNF